MLFKLGWSAVDGHVLLPDRPGCPIQATVQSMFAAADANHDGQVSFDEFMALVSAAKRHEPTLPAPQHGRAIRLRSVYRTRKRSFLPACPTVAHPRRPAQFGAASAHEAAS